MRKNKSPLLLFKSVEEIISAKDKNYIKNEAINLSDLNNYTLIYRISFLFKSGESYSEKYTFDYKDNKFIRRKPKNQELLKDFDEKIYKRDDILNFIKNTKKVEKRIIHHQIRLKMK